MDDIKWEVPPYESLENITQAWVSLAKDIPKERFDLDKEIPNKSYKIDKAIIQLLDTEKAALIIAQLVEGTNILRVGVPLPIQALRDKCVGLVINELSCISSSGLNFRSDDRWAIYSTNPDLRKCISYAME